ncbi:MAG: hypothetical protein HY811_00080, partial [Planctomycetes bacterium]|nr:hypothetical protein [Planctomycetota bacterium]
MIIKKAVFVVGFAVLFGLVVSNILADEWAETSFVSGAFSNTVTTTDNTEAVLSNGVAPYAANGTYISANIAPAGVSYWGVFTATYGETVDSCEAIAGWVNGWGIVSVNNTTYKEKVNAINITKTNAGITDFSVYKNITAINLTGKTIRVWLYIKDQTTLNKVSSVEVFLFNAYPVWAWYVYKSTPKASLAIGWNLVSLDTNNPEAINGTPNLNSVGALRLDINTVNAADLYAAGDVIMDFWYMSNSTPVDTSLNFDVLDGANNLIASVASGDNLALKVVNASTYPQIKLRANFVATDTNKTPVLCDWYVSYSTANPPPVVMAPGSFDDLVTCQLDGDAEYEFAGGNIGGEVYAMDNDGTFKWSRTGLGYIMSLSAGDVNAD